MSEREGLSRLAIYEEETNRGRCNLRFAHHEPTTAERRGVQAIASSLPSRDRKSAATTHQQLLAIGFNAEALENWRKRSVDRAALIRANHSSAPITER